MSLLTETETAELSLLLERRIEIKTKIHELATGVKSLSTSDGTTLSEHSLGELQSYLSSISRDIDLLERKQSGQNAEPILTSINVEQS